MAKVTKSFGYCSSSGNGVNSKTRTNIASPDVLRTGYGFQETGTGQSQFFLLRTAYPPPRFDLDKGKIRWGAEWVVHKPGRYNALLAYGPPNYNYISLERSGIPEAPELVRFLLTLELWERTPGEKVMTPYEIWAKSLIRGPVFAEELSDLFASLWRASEFDSYNFLFPSRFLPRWVEAVDDLSLSKTRTYADPDVLEEFRHTLRSLLEEDVLPYVSEIELPLDEEILFEKSTTTSYVYSQDRTCPQWEASFMNTHFNSKELRAQRCVVPVYPGGTRDTIIADITANHSIRWMERAMRHILQYVPESAVTLYSLTFNKRLNQVVKTKGYHILRDIKKCGITYNSPDLFPIVSEELERIFGDIRFRRLDIFKNFYIKDDDTEYKAERGYGLGMANHVVTLCNIVIYRMSRNAISQRYDDFKIRNITGNDDQDTVILGRTERSRQIAEYYLNTECDIHGALGNLVHFDKSVVKPYGLFYEQYDKKGWRNKEALICNALACAYLAPNIRVAKHYISCQSDRFSTQWAQKELSALAHWWGEEFFDVDSELYIHYEVGGWLDTRSLGLKTTMRDIDYLESQMYDMSLISAVLHTCEKFITGPKPHFKTPGIVNNYKYIGAAKQADPRVQLFTLSEEDLMMYYKKLTKHQRVYSSRLDKYQSKVHSKVLKYSKIDLFKILLKKPWYCIPDSLAEGGYPKDQNLYYDFTSELSLHSEDIMSDMLNEEALYDDATALWNPTIDIRAIDRRVPANYEDFLMASQFSNSGFLPMLEYHLRYREYPIISFTQGRMRIPAPAKEREKVTYRDSLTVFHKKKKVKEPIRVQESFSEETPWDNGDQTEEVIETIDINLILQEEMDMYRALHPAPREPEEIQEREGTEVNLDVALDLLLGGGHVDTIFTGDHFQYPSDYEGPSDHSDEEPSNMFGDDQADY